MWGHRASECTYYSRAVTCRRCDENNHPQDDPPHATKECPHFERSPSELRCRGCSQIGHLRATCPLVTCNRCGAPGHIVSGCPQPIICAKCKLPGHIARLCTTVISRAYLQTVRPIQDAYNPRDELRDLGDQPLNPAPVCAPGDGLGTGEVGTDKETGWGLGSDDGTADGDADASGWGKAQPMPGGGGW